MTESGIGKLTGLDHKNFITTDYVEKLVGQKNLPDVVYAAMHVNVLASLLKIRAVYPYTGEHWRDTNRIRI